MKILVVGGGGREHALCWKLAQEHEVFASPGNAGIRTLCESFAVTDHDGIAELAARLGVGLVVVGPEEPLIGGLADQLRGVGVPVLGPGAHWARLEGDKAFAKNVMVDCGVPTASFGEFSDFGLACDYVRSQFGMGKRVVVKATGPALGKGVVVADTEQDALDALDSMLVDRDLGESGSTVVIEERLFGREFSLMVLVNESGYWALPVAQDHKRAFDGDNGPNTGGMGAFCPVPWLDPDVVDQCLDSLVAPIQRTIASNGRHFRGVLFCGVMLTDEGPKCLEFNVRFGDPETQTVLPLIGDGFAETLLVVASGGSPDLVRTSGRSSVTVVVASAGYPGPVAKGKKVSIGELPPGTHAFHAGTAESDGEVVTSGGRVVGVNAVAADLSSASMLAYQAVGQVSFEGAWHRSDIGAPAGRIA